MPDDLSIPRFFTSDACKAAGIEMTTLRNWISRDPPAILLREEDRAAIVGGAHLLSYRRVMQIALTAFLSRCGLSPRRAGMMAAVFTDMGNSRRKPCELFSEGETLLIAMPGEDAGQDDTEVVQARGDFPVSHLIGGARPSIAIHVNSIDRRVREALGLV